MSGTISADEAGGGPGDEEKPTPALFEPRREKSVKQLITFYYYWKRKSTAMTSAAATAERNASRQAEQAGSNNCFPMPPNGGPTSSFRGSSVETNFNCSKKRRPTGRGGIPREFKLCDNYRDWWIY